MRRYAAFLRGVSPTNAKMPEVAACFKAAGVSEVRTVLASGNVVFAANEAKEARLASAIEAVMTKRLGRTFLTIVRSIDHLQALLDRNAFASHPIPASAKRVVTFLRDTVERGVVLPIERSGATIWCLDGNEVLTSYLRSDEGPVFMELIKRTFGEAQTTRTWDTILKVVKAASAIGKPQASAQKRS